MRTDFSTSEPSIVDQLEALSLSSASDSSARPSSVVSSQEYIVIPRTDPSSSSASSRNNSINSSAVLVSAPGSRQPSEILQVRRLNPLSRGYTFWQYTSQPTSMHTGHPLPSFILPNAFAQDPNPRTSEVDDRVAEVSARVMPAGLALSEVGSSMTSASLHSTNPTGAGLKKKARQKLNRRLRRQAEQREERRIQREYGNHTPADIDRYDKDDENEADSDGESDISVSTEMSSSDARSSIDAFLRGDAAFMGDKANKLVLWQSLCVEFGLCRASDSLTVADLPYHRPGSPSSHSDSSHSSEGSDDSDTTVPSLHTARSITPKAYHPLPQSLGTAKRLLRAHAHVNLADYLEERKRSKGRDANDYSHLVHPSAKAMRRYTLETGRFVKLKAVKQDWLQPLLKDFGFKTARS